MPLIWRFVFTSVLILCFPYCGDYTSDSEISLHNGRESLGPGFFRPESPIFLSDGNRTRHWGQIPSFEQRWQAKSVAGNGSPRSHHADQANELSVAVHQTAPGQTVERNRRRRLSGSDCGVATMPGMWGAFLIVY